MPVRRLLLPVLAAQTVLGARVLLRLLRSAGGRRIDPVEARLAGRGAVSLVVPVLDEGHRLAPCLAGLLAQGPEVAEILVVDGGSVDGTRDLVRAAAARDPRLQLVDAAPVRAGWNGKAWGMQVGLQRAAPSTAWLLFLDADVRPSALLARSLLVHAGRTGLPAFSAAPRQNVAGLGQGLLHPALLATLVYRFGIPGHIARRVRTTQANGQCLFVRRDALEGSGALVTARASRCEDVTIARCLVRAGYPVGFYEAGDLVSVQMYATAGEAWRNWPRSLSLRDQYWGVGGVLGLMEVALVQALPPWLLLAGGVLGAEWWRGWPLRWNAVLVAARLGVLVGMRRAYQRVPWTYWGSLLLDLPVAIKLCWSAAHTRHIWRGRTLV